MRNSSTSVEYLMADPHGTATVSVDGLTTTVSRRHMDPFGNPRGTISPTWEPNSRGFVNGVDDPSTGLTHLGAREYDSKLGRFISVDPLLDVDDPKTLNGYRYGNNSPATYSDPDGLREFDPEPSPGSGMSDKEFQDLLDSISSTPEEIDREVEKQQVAKITKHREAKAQAQKKIKKVVKDLVKIVADELGITDALNCFTNGDLGACVATGVTVLSSFAGGIAGKLISKYLFHAKKAWKLIGRIKDLVGEAIDGIKGLRKAEDELAAAANCVRNSFVPGTKVLMADGTQKSIESLEIGERVVVTDPRGGTSSARPVVRTIVGTGTKDIVKITVLRSDEAVQSAVIATAGHPFYLPLVDRWVTAGDLKPGDRLASLHSADAVLVASVQRTSAEAEVHNLTVQDIHTYYIIAAGRPVLVHNCGPDIDDLYSNAVQFAPGQGSPAARAYDKHMRRPNSSLPVIRSGKERAAAADDRVADLLTNPKSAVQKWNHGEHGDVIDYLLPNGGARWKKSGEFVGFLE
jgi:RHS repeat-associated protein